jgi:hypothetical protein
MISSTRPSTRHQSQHVLLNGKAGKRASSLESFINVAINFLPSVITLNRTPCSNITFRCFDLSLVERDCLFCRDDTRRKLDIAVENCSQLLVHMSLQSLSDCKHDSTASRARIEQLDLLRKRQKPPFVSKSCCPATLLPSLRIRQASNLSTLLRK